MVSTIIFDWGGVLTKGKHTSAIAKILSRKYDLENVYLKLDPLMKFIDSGEIDFKDFLVKLNLVFNTNISIKEMKQIFAEAIHPNLLLIKKLDSLKKKYRLLMLSNNSKVNVEIIKNKNPEILEHFEKCYFSYELKMRKPKKEIFEHVIKDAKLIPQECVFVDDKDKNVKMAEKLGMHGVVFTKNSDLDFLI